MPWAYFTFRTYFNAMCLWWVGKLSYRLFFQCSGVLVYKEGRVVRVSLVWLTWSYVISAVGLVKPLFISLFFCPEKVGVNSLKLNDFCIQTRLVFVIFQYKLSQSMSNQQTDAMKSTQLSFARRKHDLSPFLWIETRKNIKILYFEILMSSSRRYRFFTILAKKG